jgi:hypothetical protein
MWFGTLIVIRDTTVAICDTENAICDSGGFVIINDLLGFASKKYDVNLIEII